MNVTKGPHVDHMWGKRKKGKSVTNAQLPRQKWNY